MTVEVARGAALDFSDRALRANHNTMIATTARATKGNTPTVI